MKEKLEAAKKIIALNEKKDNLSSKIDFLKRDLYTERYPESTSISLNNGLNGGYVQITLKGDRKALQVVNKALLEYIEERIIKIDNEIESIEIK